MRLTKRDVVATVLVAATLIPYVGYLIQGEMPFINDARGMGALGIILGAAAWSAFGPDGFGPRWFGIGAALLALGVGIAAAVLETGTAAAWLLAAFMVLMVAMWLTAIVRRTGLFKDKPGRGRIARHA